MYLVLIYVMFTKCSVAPEPYLHLLGGRDCRLYYLLCEPHLRLTSPRPRHRRDPERRSASTAFARTHARTHANPARKDGRLLHPRFAQRLRPLALPL